MPPPSHELLEEVSCRSIEVFLDVAEERGIAPAALLENVPYSVAHLRGRKTWVDWLSFTRFLENAGRFFSEEELEAIGAAMVRARQFRALTAIASLASSPAGFITWMSRSGGARRVFSCIEVTVRTISRNEIEITERLPEGYPVAREFWIISRGVHRAIPTLFGFPEASVAVEAGDDNSAILRVRFAERGVSTSGLRRLLGRRFWSRGAAQEIKEAYEELESRYNELNDQIRARKRAEEENARWSARVRESQRLESLGLLAGGVAHDFNNLLVGIQGNAELTLHELPRDASVRPRIMAIVSSAEQASNLTRRLLVSAGKAHVALERVQPAVLVDETLDLLRSGVARGAVLEHEGEGGQMWTEADATQLRQVFMNLVVNAVESAEGARPVVRVRTRAVDADRRYLEDFHVGGDLHEGRYVCVEVSDNGCGMSEGVKAKIFEPFYSTKAPTTSHGRGLGLAATLGIVAAHGGGVSVESAPGEGTTFRILLPTSLPAREEPRPAPAEVIRGAGTVLLVEDEPIVRDVVEKMMQSLGFEVISAGGGESALRLFRAEPASVRAVMLDMTMPGMDGHTAFAALREVRPDVPVLFYSGYTDIEAPAPRGSGAVALLQKPFTISDLSSKLRELLDRELGSPEAPPLESTAKRECNGRAH